MRGLVLFLCFLLFMGPVGVADDVTPTDFYCSGCDQASETDDSILSNPYEPEEKPEKEYLDTAGKAAMITFMLFGGLYIVLLGMER